MYKNQTLVAVRTDQPPELFGDLSDPVWEKAPWMDQFFDIRGIDQGSCQKDTRIKFLFDDDFLYIGALVQENELFATMTETDSEVWRDNAMEFFFDPTRSGLNYYELEVNVIGTTWLLKLDAPYIFGGHANSSWSPETKLEIVVDGEPNFKSEENEGWAFEWALPWSAFCEKTSAPTHGETWSAISMRMNWPVKAESQKFVKDESKPEKYWVCSATGTLDIHRPHAWSSLVFVDEINESLENVISKASLIKETRMKIAHIVGLDHLKRHDKIDPNEFKKADGVEIHLAPDSGWTVTSASPCGTVVSLNQSGQWSYD